MFKEISTNNFDQEVLKSEIPVLADLWAPWCGPCKALTPTVEAVANEYKDNLKVVKINVDDNPSLAAKYSVMSIPTLLFFKDGAIKEQIIGLVPKEKIINKISSYV
ncbi:MAG: thioredoxin [Candidatus Cloacimonetes bacterium]|nr:thioredoxin [Candidatus Cloacimonadota bacterium]